MGGESGLFVEERPAFRADERPRLRVDPLVGRQGARRRSVKPAITLVRFVDVLFPLAEMDLQGADGLGADRALRTFKETAFR